MPVATITSVTFAVLMRSLLSSLSAAGGKVLLYDSSYIEYSPDPVAIYPGPAQRCYSFACYHSMASFITWEDTQEESQIVFYRNPNCTGKAVHMRGPDGKLSLVGTNMNFRVSSFMILESGVYPTRGFRDLCLDESALYENDTLAT